MTSELEMMYNINMSDLSKHNNPPVEHAPADANPGILYDQIGREPRRELAPSEELLNLQLKFAKEIAERTGMDVLEAVKLYTGYLYKLNLKDFKHPELGFLDGVTVDNVVQSAFSNYYRLRLEKPHLFVETENYFGCFYYDYDEETKTVTVHFTNTEQDPNSGPLSTDKLPQRQKDITDMLRHIKEHHPQAEHVEGGSWLYNLESYCRLFPKNYIAAKEPKNVEDQWHRLAVWGQFLDSNNRIKQDLADQFLAKAKEAPLDDLMAALPFHPLKVHGNINDFYNLYKVQNN